MSKGFTSPELLIVVAIIAAIVVPAFVGNSTDSTFGWNGVTETRCQGGFKVLVGANGFIQQLVDQNGHGIPCK